MTAGSGGPVIDVLGMMANAPIEEPQTGMGPHFGNLAGVRGREEMVLNPLLQGCRRSPRQVEGEDGEVQRARPRSSSTPIDDANDPVRAIGGNEHIAQVVVEMDDITSPEMIIFGVCRRLNCFKEHPRSTIECSQSVMEAKPWSRGREEEGHQAIGVRSVDKKSSAQIGQFQDVLDQCLRHNARCPPFYSLLQYGDSKVPDRHHRFVAWNRDAGASRRIHKPFGAVEGAVWLTRSIWMEPGQYPEMSIGPAHEPRPNRPTVKCFHQLHRRSPRSDHCPDNCRGVYSAHVLESVGAHLAILSNEMCSGPLRPVPRADPLPMVPSPPALDLSHNASWKQRRLPFCRSRL